MNRHDWDADEISNPFEDSVMGFDLGGAPPTAAGESEFEGGKSGGEVEVEDERSDGAPEKTSVALVGGGVVEGGDSEISGSLVAGDEEGRGAVGPGAPQAASSMGEEVEDGRHGESEDVTVTSVTLSQDDVGVTAASVRTSRRGRVQKRRILDDDDGGGMLNACLCGVALSGTEPDAIRCRKSGCETVFYHRGCTGAAPNELKNWKCSACADTVPKPKAKKAKRA